MFRDRSGRDGRRLGDEGSLMESAEGPVASAAVLALHGSKDDPLLLGSREVFSLRKKSRERKKSLTCTNKCRADGSPLTQCCFEVAVCHAKYRQ